MACIKCFVIVVFAAGNHGSFYIGTTVLYLQDFGFDMKRGSHDFETLRIGIYMCENVYTDSFR